VQPLLANAKDHVVCKVDEPFGLLDSHKSRLLLDRFLLLDALDKIDVSDVLRVLHLLKHLGKHIFKLFDLWGVESGRLHQLIVRSLSPLGCDQTLGVGLEQLKGFQKGAIRQIVLLEVAKDSTLEVIIASLNPSVIISREANDLIEIIHSVF